MNDSSTPYIKNAIRAADVVIIGAGHAGCEAALAIARLGCDALLITMALDTVAQMSCNPAIGGLAKGQLVREIDAMGGAMALATDATGIQFRMLNSSKGPAVQSPRAQADKWAYQHWMKRFLETSPGVRMLQDRVVEIVTENERVVGVRTAIGLEIACKAVVVCTGTFPRGKTHIGSHQAPGGRFGEPAAEEISGSLTTLGLPLMRLKTGTCPRVLSSSLDYDRMTIQPGDESPVPFSFLTRKLEVEQVPCYATWTTPETQQMVADILESTPLFNGQIEGVGPRYCPSFELKVARFPDKDKHHIFVEPEGRYTEEVYLNGLATSIDPEAQVKMVHSIPGLEKAEFMRFGYAVEYDAICPSALRDTLETKKIAGLYCAGQMNGTSGYEEAGAQGLIAGINAALAVQQRPPFRLRRDQAYIGVLVDDLVTRGTNEPYRLFTSRAEYRLLLRQDNADLRLTPVAKELGLVDDARAERAERLQKEVDDAVATAAKLFHEGKTIAQHLRNPKMEWTDVLPMAGGWAAGLSERVAEQLRIACRYDGYLQRNLAQIKRVDKSLHLRITDTFDYDLVQGLSNEAREKLKKIRPETLGQASKISGVSPADLAILSVRLSSLQGKFAAAENTSETFTETDR